MLPNIILTLLPAPALPFPHHLPMADKKNVCNSCDLEMMHSSPLAVISCCLAKLSAEIVLSYMFCIILPQKKAEQVYPFSGLGRSTLCRNYLRKGLVLHCRKYLAMVHRIATEDGEPLHKTLPPPSVHSTLAVQGGRVIQEEIRRHLHGYFCSKSGFKTTNFLQHRHQGTMQTTKPQESPFVTHH